MFYRVVLQGRPLGNADVSQVKREFVRVTGLSSRVTDDLFGGMPQVIKRQVAQADAERIAATLRAIGVAATVERELPGNEPEARDEIRMVTPLDAGPPTIIPGSEPAPAPAPSRAKRWLRAAAEKWPVLLGGAGLVAAAILLAPFIDDFLTNPQSGPAGAPAQAKKAQVAESAEAALVINPALLFGPWRCTDQRSGLATYWSYGADGSLFYHGDVLRDLPATGASLATWTLEGRHLSHTFEEQAPATFVVTELTLARLRYGDERADIACRRP